jgi:hypothetical protein
MATLSVMTWSVEKVFAFLAKVAVLAPVIHQQDADVVVFQVVGGEPELMTWPSYATRRQPDAPGAEVTGRKRSQLPVRRS